MNFLLAARVLWRFRVVVVAGVLVAAALAALFVVRVDVRHGFKTS